MPTSPLYLLDTNLLVHYVRRSPVWIKVRDTYQLLQIEPTPFISVVSHGELRSLAAQWKWGEKKLDQMEFCLKFFPSQTIDTPDILRTYAGIDAYLEENGQPLGKNDVWIAATAAVFGATLLTTDRDFDRLHPHLLTRVWIDPDTTA